MNKIRILIIDVGHGGTDPGASGNGIVEKVANLNTALALKAEAERHGIKVFITRTTDVTISLEARVQYANNIAKQYPGAEIYFVSIHHNAGGGDRAEGIHSIYRGKGQALANSVLDEMANKLGQQKKVYEKVGSDNKDYYYVIKNTSMDAVIIEVCFLDNASDVQIADTVAEQQRNGIVIAHGILKHFGVAIKENTTSNVKTYRNVVIYKEGALPDKATAEFFCMVINYRKEDCVCISDTEYKKGFIQGVSVYTIGGGTKDIKAHVHLSGAGRNETAEAVLERLSITM